MNRKEFEEKCLGAGLKDYQFNSIEEIKKVLNLDLEKIDGYRSLSKTDIELCNNFIVNYISSIGIANKITFKPIKINNDGKLKINFMLGNNVEWLHIASNGTEWY